MRYLYHYRYSLNPKNQLETSIYNFLASFDRTIINKTDLNKFQHEILYGVEFYNSKFKRCIPIKLKFIDSSTKGDISLFVGTGDTSPVQATLLKIKD